MIAADAPPDPGNDEAHLGAVGNVADPNSDFFTDACPVNEVAGSERDRLGLLQLMQVLRELYRARSPYDPLQQRVISFVAISAVIHDYDLHGMGTREIAASLSGLHISHELVAREIERVKQRLPELRRAHGGRTT